MAFSLSEEDNNELKEDTAELIALLEQKLEENNKKRNKRLLKVLQTRNEVQECRDKIRRLEDENKVLSHQVAVLFSDIYDLVGRERAPNLIVHGVKEKVDEDEKKQNRFWLQNILNYFKEVGIDLKCEKVVLAERLGEMVQGKLRPVLMKLSHPP